MGDRAELRPKMVELRDRDLRPRDGETDPPHSVETMPAPVLCLSPSWDRSHHLARTGPFKGRQPARNGSTSVSMHHREEADNTSQVD